MIKLKKSPDRDFILLNLTDPQLGSGEWEEGHKNKQILTATVTELIERVKPDLITISGDLAWAGNAFAYKSLADFIDGFGIPWAPVWGNHDNQDGAESVDSVADLYLTYKNCVYEKGDPVLGNGNYVIAVEENGTVVEGIIMMDSHDRMPYTDPSGKESSEWAKLIPEQLDWYRAQVKMLEDLGCHDTTMIMHIPIFAYREAFYSAFNSTYAADKIAPKASTGHDCWKEGYKDSVGVKYEDICSYPADDGAFDVMLELGSTKHILCGHDHVNNYIIKHKGVKFIYTLKTGAGCYWNPILNGGTVLRIGSEGVSEAYHEYVDVSRYLD